MHKIKDCGYWIEDEAMFDAVNYARKLMSEGDAPGVAIWKAHKKHNMPMKDIGFHSGRISWQIQIEKDDINE